MQRHGCLHVDRYRWQLYGKLHCRWSLVLIRKWKKTRNYCQPEPILPITFALRELSFAPSPRLGSLTWFPQCLPEQLHPNTHGCASVQLRPQIPSMSTPYGAVCYENFQPYAGQQSLLSVWYMCHCGYMGTEFYSEAHFLSVDKKNLVFLLGLAAGVACRRLPICAEGEAMQHWLTALPPPTSGNNQHGLIQSTWKKTECLQKGSGSMLKWFEIKPCSEQSFSAMWVIHVCDQSFMERRYQTAGGNFQISLVFPEKNPPGDILPPNIIQTHSISRHWRWDMLTIHSVYRRRHLQLN